MNGELVVAYDENKGYRVVSAPRFADFDMDVLEKADGELLRVTLGMITVCEQVIYRQDDYDHVRCVVKAELVKDMRKDKVNGDWWMPSSEFPPEPVEVYPRYDSEEPT